ncbi:lipopolysaccharide-modifying protein [Hordeum vulgare]|nr:lipopolysaccharide-modifying protein [Hordeum vulgare]
MRRDRASASMHVTITRGGTRLHVDLYHACMKSRALFTVWSLWHLMRQYPGRVPDMDLMFDCMDRSAINRTKHTGDGAPPPPPLFRYCTTREHLDIEPWSREFKSIKQGSRRVKWTDRVPTAYSTRRRPSASRCSPATAPTCGQLRSTMWTVFRIFTTTITKMTTKIILARFNPNLTPRASVVNGSKQISIVSFIAAMNCPL